MDSHKRPSSIKRGSGPGGQPIRGESTPVHNAPKLGGNRNQKNSPFPRKSRGFKGKVSN